MFLRVTLLYPEALMLSVGAETTYGLVFLVKYLRSIQVNVACGTLRSLDIRLIGSTAYGLIMMSGSAV